MTRIVKEDYFDGSKEKIDRLGLWPLIAEIKSAIASFTLEIKKEVHGNGSATLRELIDAALRDVGDWTNTASGDVDWIKCRVIDGIRVCVGVEVQMSARSDLIFRDIVHFQKQMREGQIDVCVEILPSDALSPYLTDRTPRYSDGVRDIKEMRADDLPVVLIAIEHDGFSDMPLGKKTTNRGKQKT
jgi:hypothetical protein